MFDRMGAGPGDTMRSPWVKPNLPTPELRILIATICVILLLYLSEYRTNGLTNVIRDLFAMIAA